MLNYLRVSVAHLLAAHDGNPQVMAGTSGSLGVAATRACLLAGAGAIVES